MSKPAGNIIHSTSAGINLNSMVFEWIASKGETFTQPISEIASGDLNSTLTNLGIPSFLQNMILNMIDLSEYENMCLANLIAPKAVSILLSCLCFVVIFLIVLIISKILAKLSSKIVKGSALGFFDGLLGALWSGVKVAVFVSLVMLGLSFVSTLSFGQGINSWITNDMRLMDESFGIAKIFYEHNPLLYVIEILPFWK